MLRAFLFSLPLVLLSSACTYDNGDAQRYNDPQLPESCGTPVEAKIDVDRELDIAPGQGAGVFIQYKAGGHWEIRTSCDSSKNSADCKWDIIVTPEDGASLSNVVSEDLESTDAVRPFPDDDISYQLTAYTNSDIDGFTFDSQPGAAIAVDAFLDEACALPYFFWVGDDALHPGSPSNPLYLVPSAP